MEKVDMIKKYLKCVALKGWDWDQVSVNTDHINGWENKSTLTPDHLNGQRFFNYCAGQKARTIRDNDWFTYISSKRGSGDRFGKKLRGRISHKRVVEICEKEEATDDITVYITDGATGKITERSIGY